MRPHSPGLAFDRLTEPAVLAPGLTAGRGAVALVDTISRDRTSDRVRRGWLRAGAEGADIRRCDPAADLPGLPAALVREHRLLGGPGHDRARGLAAGVRPDRLRVLRGAHRRLLAGAA